MATPLPWSHSSLSGFMTCGRQYEELKVLRNYQDQKNDASIWGDRFHTEAEAYIRAAVAGAPLALTPEMEQYKSYLDQFVLRPGKTLVEQEYAIDRHLRPCPFSAPETWGRGIIDVLTIEASEAWVDDHKTGANRKKDMQQLIIFALLTFYHHDEVETVHTAFHWLQLKAKDSETFRRHQIPQLWETLLPKLSKYAHAFHSGVFVASPSGLCKKHCAVETCEFHGIGNRR